MLLQGCFRKAVRPVPAGLSFALSARNARKKMIVPLVTIREASLTDAHALASVIHRTFQDAPWALLRNEHAKSLSTAQQQALDGTYLQKLVEEMRLKLSHPNFITKVAMHDGQIAGCAVWYVGIVGQNPHRLEHCIRKVSLRERIVQMYLATKMAIRSWLPKWLTEWIGRVSKNEQMITQKTQCVAAQREEAKARWLPVAEKGGDYLVLNWMAVLPEYRRKGIGRALVQQGLDIAKQNGVAIYFNASPAGRHLYDRLGGEILEEYQVGDQEINTWKETIMRFLPV